jgi:hypothetical protein
MPRAPPLITIFLGGASSSLVSLNLGWFDIVEEEIECSNINYNKNAMNSRIVEGPESDYATLECQICTW